MKSQKDQYLKYAGMMTFSYMSIGILFPLLPQYMASIGYGGTQIGTLAAVGTTIGIFSTPLWAGLYAHKNQSRLIMAAAYMIPVILIGLMRFSEVYLILLALYVGALFFQAPMFALQDSNTLISGNDFGKVRKWGAVGFATGSLIAGLIAQKLGLVNIFQIYGIAMLVGMIFFLAIRKKPAYSRVNAGGSSASGAARTNKIERTGVFHGFKTLAGNSKFICLTTSAFFMMGTSMAHNNYFGFMLKGAAGLHAENLGTMSAYMGGDMAIGLAFLLMAGSEMPFMQMTDYLIRRFGVQKITLIPIVVSALRFMWYASYPNPVLILVMFFLQGIANGLYIVSALRYVSEIVEESKLSVAVSLYTAVTVSFGTIFCQFFGGIILDLYNGAAVYFMFGIMNIISILLYLAFGLHKKVKSS